MPYYDIKVEEVLVHRFRVKAKNQVEAKEAAEQVLEERDYDAQYLEDNGVPERMDIIAKRSKDTSTPVANRGSQGEEGA